MKQKRNNYGVNPETGKRFAGMCDPTNYGGNNKSEWIKKLATAAAHILCEIETIQAIKGDGIYQR